MARRRCCVCVCTTHSVGRGLVCYVVIRIPVLDRQAVSHLAFALATRE